MLRHHRRTAALRKRQNAERAVASFCTGRTTVVAVMSLASFPCLPADGEPSVRALPPAAPYVEVATQVPASLPAAPAAKQQPKVKAAAK